MRMRPTQGIALAGLVAAALQATGSAQDKLCPKCHTTGRVSNEVKDAKLAQMEAPVIHCSHSISRDKAGRGLPFLPCAGCLAPALAAQAQVGFDKLAAEKDAWLAERRKIDAALRPREEFVHIETEHFLLVFGLPKVVLPDKVVLDAHAAAHLYAARLEEFYSWFQELLGYTDEEARVLKHQVFLMNDLRTLMKAATDYAQTPTDRAGRAVGDPSILVTWRDRSVFKSDPDFHRHVVHHVSHLLLGVFHLKVWLVDRAGWLEEGLAHVCEMRLFGLAGNSCNIEQSEEDMPDEDWEPLVKKMVLQKQTAPFALLKEKRADLLTAKEHLQVWAITDFLLKRDQKQLPELIRRLKQDVPLRDALRELYDLSIVSFDLTWSEWVEENYRLKP